MSQNFTRSEFRKIISNKIFISILNEGVWDDVKVGAGKLRSFISKKFNDLASKWGGLISSKITKFSDMPDEVEIIIGVLKDGMKETGESVKLDDTLKQAKEFGKITKQEAINIAQKDLVGPVYDYAKQLENSDNRKQESKYYAQIYSVLSEMNFSKQKEKINEVIGVTSVLGVSLALLGGLPMLFKGLTKLAKVMKAESLVNLFEKAYHITHKFEVDVINVIVPDKLAYAIYKIMHKKGIKFSEEKNDSILEFEDFQKDTDGSHAMKRINSLLYKTLLIYFVFNGIDGVLHAGASLVGVVEAGATTVKGIELAAAAAEIAALAGKAV